MGKFIYHGPPVFIVALQQEVTDGDEVEGPDALEASAGFEKVSSKGKAKDTKDDKGDD